MNYSEIVSMLDKATGFDLFRIRAVIDRMLDDPKRIVELKKHLRVGQEIEYFDPNENRTIIARVVEFKRTRVAITHVLDGQKWTIPYYYINIHGVDTNVSPAKISQGLARTEVKVGDKVGFLDGDNGEVYGDVCRLNQKTVTLNCDGHKWRVSYSYLFKVLAPSIDALPEYIPASK